MTRDSHLTADTHGDQNLVLGAERTLVTLAIKRVPRERPALEPWR